MSDNLDTDKVKKVALLARLKLSDAEVSDYASKLGNILKYVETLNEVDTHDIEPMVHAVELSNVFRADQVQLSLPRGEALRNAPKSDGVYFLVPQILEDK